MDLRCNRTDCKYNDKYTCRAKEIHVSKETSCRTFEKDSNKDLPPDIPSTMFEGSIEIAPFREKSCIDIKCNAKCLFNKNCKCIANGISVLNDKDSASCATFIEK